MTMICNAARTALVNRSFSVLAQRALQQQSGALTRALSTVPASSLGSSMKKGNAAGIAASPIHPTSFVALPDMHHHLLQHQQRRFKATDINMVKHSPKGTVTKPLRVLTPEVVEQIQKDLQTVDANADGRIQTDELKQLLRMHNSSFTEDEIFEIGEIFYAGKSGGSVPFDRFIEAVDRVVQKEKLGDVDKDEDGNPMQIGTCGNEFLFYHSHGNYTPEDLDVKLTHKEPENFRDRMALKAVRGVRKVFDTATGWKYGNLNPDMILQRVIFLETIAAVPGMVAAVVRHFKSLRSMQRDGGMMQMFLDEANNERMHLLTFVRMKDPSRLFRAAVILSQFGFGSVFGLAYVISPKFCHRFVGYVEEEACDTYTKIIAAIEEAEEGTELAGWKTQRAPRIARSYWKLGEEGTVLELMYAVRADEAEHRDVNHTCSTMEQGDQNPVANTEQALNTMLSKYVKDIMDRTAETKQAA